jgi:hypothetical protein
MSDEEKAEIDSSKKRINKGISFLKIYFIKI